MQTKLVLKQQSAMKLRFSAGATGPSGTIAVGTTTTGAPGTDAAVTNSGTNTAAVFDFTIPRGATGTAATVAAGTTTTGAAGTNAAVTNSGTSSAAVFDFTIPRGDTGTAATIAVGTVTTGAPGSSASVTNVGTSAAAVFDFTIPRGADGVTDGDKGDITVSGGVWSIDAGVVDNANLTNMAEGTFKLRKSSGSGAPEDGTPAEARTLLNLNSHGQCYLSKVSTNLVLSPKDGNKLIINGVPETIPAAGVSLAPTGLTPGTVYYIYAYMNSGTMTLEASTTTHATDTSTGVEIKSGDATRTLVGAARPVAGPAFADTEAQRFVASWFNATELTLRAQVTATQTTTSTTFVELTTSLRVEFVVLARTRPKVSITGLVSNSGGAVSLFAAGYDGISAVSEASGYAGASLVPMTHNDARQLSEGYHYVTVVGAVSSASTANLAGATQYPVIIRATL